MFSFSTLVKGEAAIATFDLAELLATNLITDLYFKDAGNLAKVLVTLTSSPGNQKMRLSYSIPANWNGTAELSTTVTVNETARDNFHLHHVILVDHQGGYEVINFGKFHAYEPDLLEDFGLNLVNGS